MASGIPSWVLFCNLDPIRIFRLFTAVTPCPNFCLHETLCDLSDCNIKSVMTYRFLLVACCSELPVECHDNDMLQLRLAVIQHSLSQQSREEGASLTSIFQRRKLRLSKLRSGSDPGNYSKVRILNALNYLVFHLFLHFLDVSS